MSNKLIQSIEEYQNGNGSTFNGAKSNESSLNKCVDLFGQVGSMRARSDDEVIQLFIKAFSEDRLKAMKILFYIRDVRGGAGERKVFRTILKYLGDNYPDIVEKNITLIAEFGRFDDLLVLEGTK